MTIASRTAAFADLIREMSDDELSEGENAILNERERRQRLANVPAQIAAMSAAFLADGGDRGALVSAIPE